MAISARLIATAVTEIAPDVTSVCRTEAHCVLAPASTGLKPDRVHPMVPVAMDEVGIDVSDQYSKDVGEFLGRLTAHYLIVVCENAEENCPRLFPGVGQRHFWPFDDPAAVETSEEEQLAAFRRIRDEIDERLTAWLASLGSAAAGCLPKAA